MIKNKEFKVLNKGFLRVVDVMGDDDRIIQAAKVSYGKDQEAVSDEAKQKLINYLVKNKHTSPLEHCHITIHVKCPMFVRSQWHRHRTWKYNEVSARYRAVPDEFYIPTEWRGQSKTNKQCSDGIFQDGNVFGQNAEFMYEKAIYVALHQYKTFITGGMSREMARMLLPQSMYTEFYATVDLHNLLHFINIRDHDHAQYEIRVYAKFLKMIVGEWCPMVYDAFNKYIKS